MTNCLNDSIKLKNIFVYSYRLHIWQFRAMATGVQHYQSQHASNVHKSEANRDESFANFKMVTHISVELSVLWFYCWSNGWINSNSTGHRICNCGRSSAAIWFVLWIRWSICLLCVWQQQRCNDRYRSNQYCSLDLLLSLFILLYSMAGPTAILSLLIQRYVAENLDFAIFLAFINGALIFILGMLNLGFLVQFISVPVCATYSVENHKVFSFNQIWFPVRFRWRSVLRLPLHWPLEVVKLNRC